MTEHEIQNTIRMELSPYAVMFRINVGMWGTPDGRRVATGVPKGFSDLFGFRRVDGKAVFIEVKKPDGRIRPEQQEFLNNVRRMGALAGIARSTDDALKIIQEGL